MKYYPIVMFSIFTIIHSMFAAPRVYFFAKQSSERMRITYFRNMHTYITLLGFSGKELYPDVKDIDFFLKLTSLDFDFTMTDLDFLKISHFFALTPCKSMLYLSWNFNDSYSTPWCIFN